MAKQKWLTRSWSMLSERTLGASNNGIINCTCSSIATTRPHIPLLGFHLLKFAWASNQHLQQSSHSLYLIRVSCTNNRNNSPPIGFYNKLHNATLQSQQHSKKLKIIPRNTMKNKEPFWPFNGEINYGYTRIKNSSKVSITSFCQ